MSAATMGKHAQKPGPDRRSWFGRRWNRSRQQAPPEPGSTGLPAPGEEQITELTGSLKPLSAQPAFAGVSMTGLADDGLDTGTLAAIREDAVPDALRILQRTRNGIRDLDKPAPLAFIRRAGLDGGFGEYWPLDGEPAFLGLAKCGDRQVAEARLGYMDDGSPLIFAGNVTEIDERIAVLMVARDRLAYGSGIGSTPASEPPAAPESAPAGQETAEAPEQAEAEDSTEDPHAVLISRATGVLGRAAFLPEPEDPAAADEISSKVAVLTQALNLHRLVSDGTVEPFWVHADLMPGEDGSRLAALERLAADIADAQADLIEVTRKYRGDDMAALVAGQAGGDQ